MMTQQEAPGAAKRNPGSTSLLRKQLPSGLLSFRIVLIAFLLGCFCRWRWVRPSSASQLTFNPLGCYTLLTSNREYSGLLIEKKQQTMFARIKKFFSEAQNEIRHVNWPTRQEATRLTFIVIGIAVVLAIFLGTFDYLFSFLIKNFILA